MRNVTTQSARRRIRYQCRIIRDRIEDQRVDFDNSFDLRCICSTHTSEIATIRTRAAQRCREVVPGWDARSWRCSPVAVLTTLQDRRTEWRLAVLGVAGQQCVNRETAGTLSENRDLGWVAAKGVNVALDPIKSKPLVKEAEILCAHW